MTRMRLILCFAATWVLAVEGGAVDPYKGGINKDSRKAEANGVSADGKSKADLIAVDAGGGRKIVHSNQKSMTKGRKESDTAVGLKGDSVKLATKGDGVGNAQGAGTIVDGGKFLQTKASKGSKDVSGVAGSNSLTSGDVSNLGVKDHRTGEKKKAQGLRDPDCRKGDKNCQATFSNAEDGIAGVVPTDTTNDGQEGYFYIGDDEDLRKKTGEREPLFYKTECVASGRDKCATTKSSIVDRKRNKVMSCEADEKRKGYTCCRRSERGACGVEALTDVDGSTKTKLNGIIVQDSACEVRKRSTDGKYFCAAGKGVFKANADKLEPSYASKCYQKKRPGEREIKVSNAKYVRDSNNGKSFEFPECGHMKGDLTFTGGWKANELRDVMKNIGLQLHASVSPVGKLICKDEGVCPAAGFKEQCFYCNFCEDQRRKGTVFEGDTVDLPCSEDARLNQRVPFKVKVCPPKDEDTLICPSMNGDLLNGYFEKKGDMDVRIEVYWRDNSKTSAQYRAEFDSARKASGIVGSFKKLALKPHEIFVSAQGIRGDVAGPDGDQFVEAVWEDYWSKKQGKGDLVGCAAFYGDYGAGKGVTDLIEVHQIAKKAGNPRDLIGFGGKQKGQACKSRRRVARLRRLRNRRI